MDWVEAMVLGMIQGLTEFLPISSTGHLYLGRHWFGLDEAGLFLDTMLHVGTLAAVVAVYRRELLYLLQHPFSRLSALLVWGTVPTAMIGLAFEDLFEEVSKTGVTIGWEFLATGLVLWVADRWKDRGQKGLEQMTWKDAVIIGTFQGAAILPAISRSGLTIAAAFFRKIDRSTAAHYSFFLSIPAIAGGVVLQGKDMLQGSAESLPLSSLLVATIMSALFGYIAVRWMIRLLQTGSLKWFSIYVSILGGLILAFQWTGRF
ncbi:undecaprenyl-diphosphatase 4 [Marinithermofilum abyssi]|uniref:Undecaprenyl-diphosphatase n=1 Tax=Marinithermofilum abyssi TaxID=1571185 RepID=A0A8J2Y8R9_9BACL|nr:undecaprenyl-diphosphate phosphatase [Marinithermofilum abyssi]GGE08084.1 undecaprenyl-diphosphatase 4 [Marinithermofilum abyssi]